MSLHGSFATVASKGRLDTLYTYIYIYIYICVCVLNCLGPFISLAFAGVSRALLGIKQMLPARLGHRSGKALKGVGKLRFGVLFWDAPSGVQTPSEAGYPSTFYEEFNGPVWVSFRGTLLRALP